MPDTDDATRHGVTAPLESCDYCNDAAVGVERTGTAPHWRTRPVCQAHADAIDECEKCGSRDVLETINYIPTRFGLDITAGEQIDLCADCLEPPPDDWDDWDDRY